jgi:16S rRNA (cytidine1402-2'-O)-methyltransferase
MLYVVPTPIGNLKDITLRALDVLKEVDLILAEDTRNTSHLLNHYGITKPISPYHQHNEHKVLNHLIEQLAAGKKIALVTDAGTPGISDPAFLLIRECIRENIKTECLPGATAFVPALVNSGIPSNRFVFEGFLPIKKGRQSLLNSLAEEERTLLFYESPMRLVNTLEEFIRIFGEDRQCCISRELTKMFEENKRGTLKEVCEYFRQKTVKGEIVIVVQGKN